MSKIDDLCAAIREETIAKHVGNAHDEARLAYHLPGNKNTVNNFDEFNTLIADYYNHHITQCVTHGGGLPILKRLAGQVKYWKGKISVRVAISCPLIKMPTTGINGGMRIILDIIADHLKAESAERYIRACFHKYVDPASWDERVEIIRQFFDRNSTYPPPSIDQIIRRGMLKIMMN